MNGQVTAGVSWPVGVTAPLVVAASFGLGWLVTRLGVMLALRRLRRAAGAPWTERAALAYPARRLVRVHTVLVPLALGGALFYQVAPELGLAPAFWAAASGLAALLGVMAVGQRLEQTLCRPDDPGGGERPAGIAISLLFYLPPLGALGLMLALIPSRWGWPAVAVLTLGAALLTVHVCGGSLLLLRRLGMAWPASPRLEAVVARTAARVGGRPRATFELASPNANALAWPVPRFLIYTSPMLLVLDDDELEAITAHELGHLDEPRAVYWMRIVASYLPIVIAANALLIGSFGLAAGLAVLVMLLVVRIVVPRVARRMEERADRLGREPAGDATGVYARALEKVYRANLSPAVMRGKRHVHPHLYDRLIAAGSPPDYPRPAPPPRVGLAALPSLLLVVACAWGIFSGMAWRNVTPGRREAYALATRGRQSYEAGNLEAAARLFRRAAEVDAAQPLYAAYLAAALGRLGRLDEADQAVLQAEAALGRGPGRDESTAAFLAQLRATIRWHREAARQDPRAGPAPRTLPQRPSGTLH